MTPIPELVLRRVENKLRKGAHSDYLHFLFLFTMFSKDLVFSKVVKNSDFVVKDSTLYNTILIFMTLIKTTSGNIVGKGENTTNQYLRGVLKTLWEKEKLLVQAISPFPTMFFTPSKTEIIIFVTFNLSSANAFNLVYKQFPLFPQCFLLHQRQKLSFLLHLICRLQMLSIWSGPKLCLLVMD